MKNFVSSITFFVMGMLSIYSLHGQPLPEKTAEPVYVCVPGCDGRFTLGIEGKRLMYGYPFPFSTSHFVIQVDGKLATNSFSLVHNDHRNRNTRKSFFRRLFDNLFKPKEVKKSVNSAGMKYLKDTLWMSLVPPYSPKLSTFYSFNGIQILQQLEPVDAEFNEIPLNEFGQYYKVTYYVKNESEKPKSIALLSLYDTQIATNDACQIESFKNGKAENIKHYPRLLSLM